MSPRSGLSESPSHPRTSRLALALTLAAAGLGCASDCAEEWPPAEGQTTRPLVVSHAALHAGVGFWPEPEVYEEWGFGERAWYLEDDTGFLEAFRALLWPTPGVLRRMRAVGPGVRPPLEPAERVWTFLVPEAGITRLEAFLERERAREAPAAHEEGAHWYDAEADYHLFHTCHHWVARALCAAGVPASTAWSLFPATQAAHLDDLAEDQAREDDAR